MLFNIRLYIVFQLVFYVIGETYSQNSEQHNLDTWTVYKSPVKNKLDRIIMPSKTQGYVTCRYLLELKNGKLMISSKSPTVPVIDNFFFLDKNNMWAAHSTLSKIIPKHHPVSIT